MLNHSGYGSDLGPLQNLRYLSILPSCVVILLALLLLQWKRGRARKRKNPIQWAPFGKGGLFSLIKSLNQPNECLELFRSSTSKVLFFPTPDIFNRIYMISDYRIVRKILGDNNIIKYETGYEFFHFITGGVNVLTTKCPSRNKHARKASRQALGNSARVTAVNEKHLQDWIKTVWEPSADTSTPVNVEEEALRLLLRVSAEVNFGYKLPRDEEDRWVYTASNEAHDAYFRFRGSPVLMATWYWIGWMVPWFRRANRIFAEFRGLVKNMMDSHDPNETATVYSGILADMEYKSQEERLSDCFTYFLAGFDTTSSAIVWLLRDLARHPQEQKLLRAELLKCQTSAERRNCPTLKNFLRESMRLNPPTAAGTAVTTTKDIPIPDSSDVIPAGAIALNCTFAVNRDRDVWGDNADEFVPSRWENPSEEMLQSFLPFSTGRRKCPGQPLAYAGLYMVLSELVTRYEFEVVDDGSPTFSLFIWKCKRLKLAVKRVE